MCPHHSPDLIQKSNNSKYFKSRTQDLKTAKTEWLMSFKLQIYKDGMNEEEYSVILGW